MQRSRGSWAFASEGNIEGSTRAQAAWASSQLPYQLREARAVQWS